MILWQRLFALNCGPSSNLDFIFQVDKGWKFNLTAAKYSRTVVSQSKVNSKLLLGSLIASQKGLTDSSAVQQCGAYHLINGAMPQIVPDGHYRQNTRIYYAQAFACPVWMESHVIQHNQQTVDTAKCYPKCPDNEVLLQRLDSVSGVVAALHQWKSRIVFTDLFSYYLFYKPLTVG